MHHTPDRKLGALVHIGWITISLLAISIPMIKMLPSPAGGLLPFFIIATAVGSGLAIWRGGGKGETRASQAELIADREKIAELEERLANVELIDSVDRKLAAREEPHSS